MWNRSLKSNWTFSCLEIHSIEWLAVLQLHELYWFSFSYNIYSRNVYDIGFPPPPTPPRCLTNDLVAETGAGASNLRSAALSSTLSSVHIGQWLVCWWYSKMAKEEYEKKEIHKEDYRCVIQIMYNERKMLLTPPTMWHNNIGDQLSS